MTKKLKLNGRKLNLGEKTLVMGIVNVTPDSFSDGGRYLSAEKAVAQAFRLLDEGADILDIGGESTRPGAQLVSREEELGRIIPVIRGVLADRPDAIISVDTWKASVAAEALKAGAAIINDVTGLFGDNDMAAVVAENKAGLVLMHNALLYRDVKSQHGKFPSFAEHNFLDAKWRDRLAAMDVVSSVELFFRLGLERAEAAGIDAASIVLDPGFGFGLSMEENLELIMATDILCALGYPYMVAASRKRFIRSVVEDCLYGGGFKTLLSYEKRGKETDDGVRDEELIGQGLEDGTGVISVAGVLRGADMVRVHDVKRQRVFLAMADALKARK